MPGVNCWRVALRVEKISAVAFWVANMKAPVQFYRDLLGTGGAGLRGAAKVCVYADPPLIKQPFWDVESVSVPFAPIAELRRENIGPWRQV